jgi:hypothetical protein
MAWEVSPILAPAIAEVKAEHPGVTIYTIGDAAHQAEKSDHNPDEWDFVCAADVMIGPNFTAAEAETLFDRLTAMIRAGDKRPAYVIYNRRIVSSTVSVGVVRAYGGTDPHTNHVHLSVPHGANPHPTTPWNLYPKEPALATPTWASQTVLDVNFLFAEARRAALGNANGSATADTNARNILLYMVTVVRSAMGVELDGTPSLSTILGNIQAAIGSIDPGPGTDPAEVAAAVWDYDIRTLTAARSITTSAR